MTWEDDPDDLATPYTKENVKLVPKPDPTVAQLQNQVADLHADLMDRERDLHRIQKDLLMILGMAVEALKKTSPEVEKDRPYLI